MRIDNKLAVLRENQGLSQEQLAWKSGVSRHAISEVELGKRIPTLKTALLLARTLKCTVDDIFTLEGS